MSLVLGVMALLALLSIPKLDWQDERAETYRGMLDEARRRFSFNVQLSGASKPSSVAAPSSTGPLWGEASSQVIVNFAEPEVHPVHAKLVDDARRMSGAGAPIDDFCRMIDPDHVGHDPRHREAFCRIVQAMVAEG